MICAALGGWPNTCRRDLKTIDAKCFISLYVGHWTLDVGRWTFPSKLLAARRVPYNWRWGRIRSRANEVQLGTIDHPDPEGAS